MIKDENHHLWDDSNPSDDFGFSFKEACFAGCACPEEQVRPGIYAGSADSYKVFKPLFNEVIRHTQSINLETGNHEDSGGSTIMNTTNTIEVPEFTDAEKDMIKGSSIRATRNLVGFPFPPAMFELNRMKVEKKLMKYFESLETAFDGEFASAAGYKDISSAAGLFPEWADLSEYQKAGGLGKDWPNNRGLLTQASSELGIMVNGEDHVTVSYSKKGQCLDEIYQKVYKLLRHMEDNLNFQYDKKLGYLSSCPSNLGAGITASLKVKLTGLSKDENS